MIPDDRTAHPLAVGPREPKTVKRLRSADCGNVLLRLFAGVDCDEALHDAGLPEQTKFSYFASSAT